MIQIQQFTFNAFSENTFLLFDETKECVIIDPGCYDKLEKEALKQFVGKNELKVVRIINTHCHIDHVLGNKFCQDTFKVPLGIPKGEVSTLKAIPSYSDVYGFRNYEASEPDELLENEGEINFGNSTLKVLYVPGHSPGHLAFYAAKEKFCVSGDVLFQKSVGRTDLPGGDMDTLLKSIRNVMFKLPDDTAIHCGHGSSTTIGSEKKNNPFCAIK